MASYENRSRRHQGSLSSRSRELDPHYYPRRHLDDPYQTDSQLTDHRHHHRRRTHHTEGRSHDDDDDRRYGLLREPAHHHSHRARSASNVRSESSRMRRSWPPQPFAEDEARSIAREYPRRRQSNDEPPARGTVDQDPVLIDVYPPAAFESQKQAFLASSRPKLEELRHSSRRVPGLDTGFEDIPELAKREPSPYVFKPESSHKSRYSNETFRSPETLTPGNSFPAERDQTRSSSHTRRESARHAARRDQAVDESDSDRSDTSAYRRNPQSSRYSFSKSDLNRKSLRTSLHHVSEEEVPRRERSDSRMDAQRNGRSDPRSDDWTGAYPRRPRNMPSATPSPPKDRLDASSSSHGGSPPRRHDQRAPATSSDQPFPPSPPHSRPGSKSGSRVPSPLSSVASAAALGATVTGVASQAHATHQDRKSHATYPPANAHSDQRQTRLDPNVRKDSVHDWKSAVPRVDVQSPSPARPARASTLPYPENDLISQVAPLPYPVSDTPLMPSEDQYLPTSPTAAQASHSAGGQSPMHSQPQNRPPRPSTRPEDEPKSPMRNNRPPSREEAQKTTGQKKQPMSLPPCPRGERTSKYDDWYHLKGMKKFDVCPYCYEDIVVAGGFKSYFVRGSPKAAGVKTKCSFSSPWVRLAWLLNDQRGRQDMDILYTLAAIVAAEPECPGDEDASREWYGLRDQYGEPVSGFHVCQCDRRNIESLLPTLQGTLVRLPGSRQKRLCSVRKESHRFSKYLDLLVDIDVQARRTQHEPDLRGFVDLVRQDSYRMECPRDNLMLDQTWHFIPNLPVFTVCEECYDHAVYPWILEGYPIAKSFNRTMYPVPGEAEAIRAGRIGGNSCQLYSPRMRRIFRTAVQDDDFRYLERKAKDRKRIELDLQAEMKKLTHAEKEAAAGNVGYGARTGAPWDRERILKEKRKLIETWKEVE